MQDFYMDDLLSGANTELEALDIQSQISKLLRRGGFPIRKWTSNSCNIMNEIPKELHETGDWLLNPETTLKTLGLIWNPQKDSFGIAINVENFHGGMLTKRKLLSNIA